MIYRFDAITLDTENFELTNDGEVSAVEPQVFSVLSFLIENRDRVVSKDELIDAVWDGRIVSDGALNSRINSARRAVGDDGKSQAVIKTIPRRGFRFVADLTEGAAEAATDASASPFDKPSIAVLPFENLSDDREQEFFSDGITEDLITALSRYRWLSVIARNTTFSYKGQSVDVKVVAQELGVRYVLEGSIRTAENRVRISALLIDGESGNQIWADRFDRELENIFALQDEITETVAGSVQSELGLTEQRRAKAKPPERFDAWEAYQRGTALLNERTSDSIVSARKYFERAIDLDPNFVLPYAAYVEAALDVYAPQDVNLLEEAQRLARKAVALDPFEPRAHAALGVCFTVNGDHVSAQAEFATALDLNPSDSYSQLWMGTEMARVGRAAKGIPHFHLAIHHSPRDPDIGRFYARLSMAHLSLAEFETAVKWGRKAVRFPNAPWAHTFLVSALAHNDELAEAKRVLAEALDRRPELSISFVRETGIMPHQNYRTLLFDGLRKAGLSEE